MEIRNTCLRVWGLQALGRQGQSSIELAAEEVQATVDGSPCSRRIKSIAIHALLARDLVCEEADRPDKGLLDNDSCLTVRCTLLHNTATFLRHRSSYAIC